MATTPPKIFWDNRFKDAVPVASSTAAGYDVLNIRDFYPFTWHKFVAMPGTITVNCGSVKSADSLYVHGHDLGTQGATVEVRRSNDNFAANDVLVASHTPADDEPFLLQWASVSNQYWRLRFTGATAVMIAIAALGVALAFPRYLALGFDPLARTPKGSNNRTEKGHPLGNVIEFEEWSAQMTFNRILQSWVRDTFKPAWKAHLRSQPFGLAWDPADHADELYLVASDRGFNAPPISGDLCNLSFKVFGVAP
ncbi:MAG: hypothetical protein AB1560_11595 [Pseudomonadota bacterium]